MTTILAITPRYPPASLVGSWMSTHEVLKHLQGCGFRIHVRTIDMRTKPHTYEGVEVDRLEHHMIGQTIHELGADLVLSHLGDSGEPHRIAMQRRVPSVKMVHSVPRSREDYAHGAALLVFNAEATRAQMEWSGASVVVHPPVDPERYRTTPGDLVTLVNATKQKGMDVVAALAASMRDVGFLAVQSDRGTSLSFFTKNGEVVPRTEDMRAVYARTRILLMPSELETWGRTAIEAAISGIPTVASPTAGLREALGAAGTFVDRGDVAGWGREIRRLLDPVEWERASTRARDRAQEVEAGRVAELDALADVLSCLTHGQVRRYA